MSLIRHHLLGRQDVSTVESSRSYFVHQQLRSQLSHDIWWIALAVFFITIAESPHYSENPVPYSTFNIIFEVVSAYGCVGISVGFPGKNYSFCGSWHTISKLILAAVTLRGRHRGLPVAIDQAVMLPNESLAWAEEEDAVLRREQTRTYGSEKMPVGTV
jgi:Trk-type K+ transport system membrane component